MERILTRIDDHRIDPPEFLEPSGEQGDLILPRRDIARHEHGIPENTENIIAHAHVISEWSFQLTRSD
jgi:hypothetical protein